MGWPSLNCDLGGADSNPQWQLEFQTFYSLAARTKIRIASTNRIGPSPIEIDEGPQLKIVVPALRETFNAGTA